MKGFSNMSIVTEIFKKHVNIEIGKFKGNFDLIF